MNIFRADAMSARRRFGRWRAISQGSSDPMTKMNAVVVHDGLRFSYEPIDKPAAGPGEVVIRVEAAGICAADRKIYSGNHPWQLPPLYQPGHEYVGSVVELGAGAPEQIGLGLGDRITAEILVPCTTCWYCRRGLYHHCDEPRVCVGAWAEYLRIPQGALIHRIPPDMAPEVAVLVEPLSCAVHAVNLGKITFNDTVVVSGLGAIGMGVLQVARLRSPHILIGLDVDERVLELARSLGAQHTINPAREDAAETIRELTEGRGCDVYIEASGSPQSLLVGIDALRKAGRLVIYGVYGKETTVDFNQVSEFKELAIVGGHLSPNCFGPAIDFLAQGSVDAAAMVTHTFPLSQYEEAMLAKSQSESVSIKTILIPD
jgi:2-desacetyl-2-hydroxyethyl bacteriochlorophyllide A dehydrogenase